jgi:SagB-type dehydrogenase family enzyme
MRKILLAATILIISFPSFSQVKKDTSIFNFDFERIEKNNPSGWEVFGSADYFISVDSVITQNGRYAAKIEYNGTKPDFKAWAFTIPDSYKGKKITLTAYVKTENVTDGWAGLWMRIDPSVAFDNMQKKGITGTTDWKKYKITLKLDPDKTKQIVVGGLLVGKGKMWLDGLQVQIDGKDIGSLEPLPKKDISSESESDANDSDLVKIKLPDPIVTGTMSVNEALLKRRSVREYKDTCLSLQEVSQMLWAAYGISDSVSWNGYGLHTAPSAGALYPLELYLVAGNVSGLPAGIYKYHPKRHYLILVKLGDYRSDLCDAAYKQDMVKSAPADIVYSAVFSRNTDKYGDRGRERYVCMDLGHSGENVYLQATALDMGTCAIGAFTDKDVSKVIGMPDAEEPLYIMPFGKLIEE